MSDAASSILDPLGLDAPPEAKERHYADVRAQIDALVDGLPDWISAMATVACELHAAFGYFDWTGFYRHVSDKLLRVGPYQGGHGCLEIPFDRGVCGAAARLRATQVVDDVASFAGHIACSTTTVSEIVLPVITPGGELLAVLDVDSNSPAAFDAVDRRELEALCKSLGRRYAETAQR